MPHVTLVPFTGFRVREDELRELGLGFTTISDAGLASLKGLSKLEKLDLWKTKITDAGLAHLKALKALRKLELVGTEVKDAGVEDLCRALPELKVSR